jgi:hypothetical protein
METGDHFKNGASPKSLTSRVNSIIMKGSILFCIALFAIAFASCTSLFNVGTSSSNPYGKASSPYVWQENTELENIFFQAINEQNVIKMKACLDSGVNINGKKYDCQRVNIASGMGMWRSGVVCSEKPFFLEAITTSNPEVINVFIENEVNVNQMYYVYEWKKDFGGCYTTSYTDAEYKTADPVATIDELFNTIVNYEILDTLLTKGMKVTPASKIKIKRLNDPEILKIFQKHGITLN